MASKYKKMTVAQLKEELEGRGLETTGKKDDLIERILSSTGKSEDAEDKKPSKKKKKEESSEEEGSDNEDKKSTKKQKTSTGKQEAEDESISSDMPENYLVEHLHDAGWKKALAGEFQKKYFKDIQKYLWNEKQKKTQVFPPEHDIFTAFNLTPFESVTSVLIGQDPYHDNNQAHGLCFSVKKGIKSPPSLVNMYKELTTDIDDFETPSHGFLEKWAKQGLLMLNATLTVVAHTANSHVKIGWQTFTDAVIKLLSDQKKDLVFMLWGGFAQKKGKIIDKSKHHVIESAHPSPLSAKKWFGCKTFSKANEALKKAGLKEIDWTLPKSI